MAPRPAETTGGTFGVGSCSLLTPDLAKASGANLVTRKTWTNPQERKGGYGANVWETKMLQFIGSSSRVQQNLFRRPFSPPLLLFLSSLRTSSHPVPSREREQGPAGRLKAAPTGPKYPTGPYTVPEDRGGPPDAKVLLR